MEATFGFIGTGSMGGALARAVAKSVQPENLWLSNRTAEKAQKLAAELGCRATTVPEAAGCRYVILGVKPQMMAQMLLEIRPLLKARTDEFVLVSMAAGLTMAQIQDMAGGEYPVIRMMPNTPVSVGSGVVLYDVTKNVTDQMLDDFLHAFSAAGFLDALPEPMMDAGCAVAGCGPAFVCLFLEALADGAVACGLPRQKAMDYAIRMVEGTSRLALETGRHPGALKDAVCSPGGATIAGVRALEQLNFRAGAMAAVEAAFHRTKELGK